MSLDVQFIATLLWIPSCSLYCCFYSRWTRSMRALLWSTPWPSHWQPTSSARTASSSASLRETFLQEGWYSMTPASTYGCICTDSTAKCFWTAHLICFHDWSKCSLPCNLVATLQLTNQNLPFGGVGESGMGAYHGTFSFDAFTHRKAVLDRSFLGEAKARYPPYTRGKLKILKGVLKGNPLAMVQAALGCTGWAWLHLHLSLQNNVFIDRIYIVYMSLYPCFQNT